MAQFGAEFGELQKRSAAIELDSEPSRQAYANFVKGKSESEVRWWTKDTIAVVTGANKGIGFEIVRQIAKEGVTVVLTARDEKRGKEAVNALKAQGLENVLFHPLDVTDSSSAAALATWAEKTFGGIDILVCNAGMASEAEDAYENAKVTLGTNYYGQKKVITELLPIIKPSPSGGRIVFTNSELGQLQIVKIDDIRKQLDNVDALTFEAVDALVEKYLQAAKEGTQGEWTNGFLIMSQYAASKFFLNAYARVLAKSLSDRPDGRKIYVNMMTPGLTDTDMTANYGGKMGRTVQHGADTASWIALFPAGGPTGQFFRDRADYAF